MPKSQNVNLAAERVDAALENAYTYAGEHKTSMLQDREARRRTEADYIGGAIVRLGVQSGVSAPVLDAPTTLAAAPIR